MRRFVLLCVVLAVSCGAAMADNFTFTYTSSIFNLTNGTLTATSNGDGSFTATAGSATFSYVSAPADTTTLQLLVPPNLGGVRLNAGDVVTTDNLIFPSNPSYFLDYVGGIAFTVTGGQFSSLGGAYVSSNTNPPSNNYYGFADVGGKYIASGDGVFTLSNVPDGGMTLMLLGGVLVGLETLRRKFRG